METDKKSDFLPYSSAPLRARFAWRAGYLLAASGIYMADQASKAWAVRALRFGDERVVIPGFFSLFTRKTPALRLGSCRRAARLGAGFS